MPGVADVPLKGGDFTLAIGEVTGIHLREDCLTDGLLDIARFGLVARMGYQDYAILRDVVTMARP